MKPPIFVYDHNDKTFYIYSSKENAETYLEAQDIPDTPYTAYDCEGYQLEFVPISPIRIWVEIRPMNPPVNKSAELGEMLRDFLKAHEAMDDDWLENASLDELTTKALEYETEVLTLSEWRSRLLHRLLQRLKAIFAS